MKKEELRQQIHAVLKSMPDNQYHIYSATICEKVLQEPLIIEGKTIAITISNKPEVDTTPLIEALWKLGKRVAVPKCNAKTKDMDFYIFQNFSELETVYMHLREPIPALTEHVEAADIDVIIVPGVVFDESGYRIGYGGGFYDRYLTNYDGELIVLAFDEQVISNVPTEIHDLPVNQVITQTREIDCQHNREGHV